ncbi:MAG: hypothetical protein QOI04_618 [Verrucomicrobiota bacterium]|jgi:hypothetical protein
MTAAAAMVAIVGIGLLAATRAEILRVQSLAPWRSRLRTLSIAFVAGVFLGGALVALLTVLSRDLPLATARLEAEAGWPLWRRMFLAAEAATTEEIVFRLFLLSILIWIAVSISKTARSFRVVTFGLANVAVAIGFGLAHLPAWSRITSLTPSIVLMVLALNGVTAVILGYAYWRHGLVAAITLHFATDVMVHGVGPIVIQHA